MQTYEESGGNVLARTVRYDFIAAGSAARQLELTAASIMEAVDILEKDLPVVCDSWHGRHRSSFDQATAASTLLAENLAGSLMVTATAIRTKSAILQGEVDLGRVRVTRR